MQFNSHFDLRGQHALLSASSYHWLKYTPDKMQDTYLNEKRKQEGTELHELASNLIVKRIKVAKLRKAFNLFVNDAIGFNMHSEQVLVYSRYAFGTADAISFRDGELRIHDLKTGVSKPSFKQLNIYAALFCLEYNVDPDTISIVQRLYQFNDFTEEIPEPGVIRQTMEKIVEMNTIVSGMDTEYYNNDF